MTTTPTSHTDAVALAAAARKEILEATRQFNSSLQQMQAAVNRLNAIGQPSPSGYAALATYANTQQTSNPGVALWEDLKAETDQIIEDYQVRRDELQAKLDAANAA